MDGIESTGVHAIAQTEAAKGAAGITTVESGCDSTVGGSVVEIESRALIACTATADHRHFFCSHGGLPSQDCCHMIHRLLSPYGAVQSIKGLSLHAGSSERSTSGEA